MTLDIRYITDIINNNAFKYRKMAFVSGPRQVGKTTMAKSLLSLRTVGNYQTWDDIAFRKSWNKGPSDVVLFLKDAPATGRDRPLLILDELHKDKRWKSALKGLFDLYGEKIDIFVIGSARLNIFKKGGDSLLGRYFNFRLHPLSLAELIGRRNDDPNTLTTALFSGPPVKPDNHAYKVLTRLMEYGGFPDPYFNADRKFSNLWRIGRIEKLIREDLRDLSRLPELSQVEILAALLPDKVGNPLSIQSLREDIEVSHDTVTRWMNYLESLYHHFVIRPYSKRILRSLKKEPKIFLYDWTEIEAHGPRFENLVASHLLKACHYWTDSGHGTWNLSYLRNKEKQEVDFLISLKGKPVLSIECKYADIQFDLSILSFAKHIGIKHHIQIVMSPNIWKRQQIEGIDVLIASADRILSYFV
jgi:predicted AAA+ superfamily ATPase